MSAPAPQARHEREAGLVAEQRRHLLHRMGLAATLLLLTTTAGTLGYSTLGGGAWTWQDCLYMTVVTLSTVGFGETLPGMAEVPYARLWTGVLIVFGSGILLYFVSTLTAFIVEVDLGGALRRSRMRAQIDAMAAHTIVCGCGTTGFYVVRELLDCGRPFVVIDRDRARIRAVMHELGAEFPFVVGDATDDDSLREAGIERAGGVVAALTDDPQNLYITISAKSLNRFVRVVAKAVDVTAREKMRRAGADAVVLPHLIGGARMVSEMVRPQVVEFLDKMLHQRDHPLRIDQVELPPRSTFHNRALREANLRSRANALLLAIEHPDGRTEYNPPPERILEAGMRLIVIAPPEGIDTLRRA